MPINLLMDNKKKIYEGLEAFAKDTSERAQAFRPLEVKRKIFPTNLALLFAILAFFFYLWQDDSLRYDPKDPHNKKMPSFIAKLVGIMAQNKFLQKYVAGIDYKNNSFQNTDLASSKNSQRLEDPNYVPTDDDLKEGRYVQINGKYFKYNSDHIYVVNGVRTYYQSARKRETDGRANEITNVNKDNSVQSILAPVAPNQK